MLKWETVIEQKALELSRYLTGRTCRVDFSEPSPTLDRDNDREVRRRILSLSQSEARELGIGKNTLHYLRKRATGAISFKLYQSTHKRLRTLQNLPSNLS